MASPAKNEPAGAEKSALVRHTLYLLETDRESDREERIQKRTLGQPEWDQSPLVDTSITTDGLTLTHATTTDYEDSVLEAEDTAAKKKKMDATSVYSYNSARDISQFVKDVHGR